MSTPFVFGVMSVMLLGSVVSALFVIGLSAHSPTDDSRIWRRHLPVTITTGMFEPDGASKIENLPDSSVVARATGVPGRSSLHLLHTAPSGSAGSGAES